MMMALMSVLIFAGALALSVGMIAMTVRPQWQRIAQLASGNVEVGFAPLATLALAERRIAVRRWAATPPPAVGRARAAA